MKQLTCEMCGGTDLIKQDGVFVCQSCGMKYSVEEAKKMMIEGTVHVVGSVSIDNAGSYDRIVELAKDAFADGMWESAYDYYCQAVAIKPNDAESVLRQGLSFLGKNGVQSSIPTSCTNKVSRAIDLMKQFPQDQRTALIDTFLKDIKSVCDFIRSNLDKEEAEIRSAELPINFLDDPRESERKIEYNTSIFKKALETVGPKEATLSDFEQEYSNKIIECADVNTRFIMFYQRDNLDKALENYPNITLSAEDQKKLVDEKNLISEAVNEKSVEKVKMLIEMGADVNDGSTEYSEPLWNIVAWKCPEEKKAAALEIVKMLMAKGALIDAERNNGYETFFNKNTDPDIKAYIISQKPELEGIESKPKTSGGCYVATAVYGSYDCPQVWTLRRYRDYTLAETWYGRAFIHTYYAISPTLVKWFGHTEWFKKMWKGKLDRMVANLKAEGVKDTPYEDRSW